MTCRADGNPSVRPRIPRLSPGLRHDLWRPYAGGGLRVEVVPGTHVNMIGEPYVDILAEAIEEVITGIPAGAG